MFQFLSGILSNKPRRTARPSSVGSLFRQPFSFQSRLNARYDAAVTNDDNRRHWSAADGLSAKTANGATIRRTLRNRARYEIANNSYARGISLTLAMATLESLNCALRPAGHASFGISQTTV